MIYCLLQKKGRESPPFSFLRTGRAKRITLLFGDQERGSIRISGIVNEKSAAPLGRRARVLPELRSDQ